MGSLPEDLSERKLQALEDDTVEYWTGLTANLNEWREILDGTLRPAEARLEYINAHSVFFFAIGGVGHALRKEGQMDLLPKLEEIDWRRTNREWQGICMLGPDIVTRRQTRAALQHQLLFKLGLEPAPPTHVLYL